MYSGGIGVWLLGLVILIWLGGLSYLILENRKFIKKLFPKDQGDFKIKLDEILQEVGSLEEFKKQVLGNVQKVGLKRYNPYKDTGGDQSFSLALLDGKRDGVVITSLHSRAGTRVFAKPVRGGKEDKFEFSEEEKEAINESI